MEYVIVKFPTNRIAYIDDEKSGQTNDVLRVEAGTHKIDLGPYRNYKPSCYTESVTGTSVLHPMEFVFERDVDEEGHQCES